MNLRWIWLWISIKFLTNSDCYKSVPYCRPSLHFFPSSSSFFNRLLHLSQPLLLTLYTNYYNLHSFIILLQFIMRHSHSESNSDSVMIIKIPLSNWSEKEVAEIIRNSYPVSLFSSVPFSWRFRRKRSILKHLHRGVNTNAIEFHHHPSSSIRPAATMN